MDKRTLRSEFFSHVPKARKGSPVFQRIFEFMYEAHLLAKPGTRLLNIYASHDFSGNREEVYREKFFSNSEYYGVDFWHDRFIPEGKLEKNIRDLKRHTLPYPDNHFDVVVTTKIIMEHISEPEAVLRELHRILKPGGEAFVIAPLVRRQHQPPYDYFRFTEYGLGYLFKKVGFRETLLTPTNGFMVTATSYAYFFQRGLGISKWLQKPFDWIGYYVIEPLGFLLDRLDNGYGRDFTLYFLARAKK